MLIDGILRAPRLADARALAALREGLAAGGAANSVLATGLAPPELERALREARALIVLAPALRGALAPSTRFFELATRARQGGVPAFAVVGEDDGDPFAARILDLQRVLEARSAPAARRAGGTIAALL